ncbi:basic proline-rich protein-like [Serinus canaria]|uniref:basic proline-rich protein-like n=1 Tax=Serinus canaria TaxID=9135 RepID=UPI0021CC79C4|nr:basic proline-rich protein-like [Serinus canaria]
MKLTKDNEEPGDSGTYPAKSSPLRGTRAPEDGALLPALPARGQGRPRARPAKERRGQRSAARRHCCPTVGSPARQPGSPPSEAPVPTECRARFGARERHRGRPPGVSGASGGDSAGRRAGAAAAPRPSCAVCVREPPPSPLNSLLPSPRTTWPPGRSSLRRGRGGTARAPLPSPPSAARAPPAWAPRAPAPRPPIGPRSPTQPPPIGSRRLLARRPQQPPLRGRREREQERPPPPPSCTWPGRPT